MIYPTVQMVDDNPSWSHVLHAYRALELDAAEARANERKKAKAAQAADESNDNADDEPAEVPDETGDDRWFARLFEIDEVDVEDLPEIHGQLIAHGFLNVDLSGRDGLVYQLTNLGKRAVIKAEDRVVDEEDADAEGADAEAA